MIDRQLALHQMDKAHPSPAGTYLAACVFYATLFKRDPTGLPARVIGKPVDIDGRVLETEWHGVFSSPNTLELVNLAPADARFLQMIAWHASPEGEPRVKSRSK